MVLFCIKSLIYKRTGHFFKIKVKTFVFSNLMWELLILIYVWSFPKNFWKSLKLWEIVTLQCNRNQLFGQTWWNFQSNMIGNLHGPPLKGGGEWWTLKKCPICSPVPLRCPPLITSAPLWKQFCAVGGAFFGKCPHSIFALEKPM